MIKDIPLDNRIAIFGIDSTTNFNSCLEWYEQFKNENLFEKKSALDYLFEHANWCICCVKDSLKVKDNNYVTCEKLTCGRFQLADFIGPVDTHNCRYSESSIIDFIGPVDTHNCRYSEPSIIDFIGFQDRQYIVFDGTGQILTHSGLVPDLWQPEVFVKTVECSINNIDYIAIEDICL